MSADVQLRIYLVAVALIAATFLWAVADSNFPYLSRRVAQSMSEGDAALFQSSLRLVRGGAGGYAGEIRPFTTPLSPEYGPVSDARLTLTFMAREWGPRNTLSKSDSATILWTTRSVSPPGRAATDRELDLRLLSLGAATELSQAGVHLAQMVVEASPRGELGQRIVTFPASAGQNSQPLPKAEARAMQNLLDSLPLRLGPMTAVPGNLAIPAEDLRSFLSSLMGTGLGGNYYKSQSGGRQMLGGAEAVGLTTIGGREAVLLRLGLRWNEWSGHALAKGSRTTKTDVEGFIAVDLATGLISEGYIRLEYETMQSGDVQERYFAVSTVNTAFQR